MSSSSSLTEQLSDVQNKMTIVIYPIWITFGIAGCLLNLIVFSRRQLRSTSCSKYFFAASLDHLMTLIIGIVPVLYSLNNPDPQTQSVTFCKLRGYMFQICLMLSRWFVAFASIDRYALTSEKVHLRSFATSKNSYRVIAAVIVFWSIICSHRLIFYQINGNFCGIVNNMIAALYHSLYVIIGGGICPTVIMMTCACLIRRNLAQKHEKRTHLSTNDHHRNPVDQQVLKILFVQVVCYIIFTIPQLGNLVFNTIMITIPNRSDEQVQLEVLVGFLAELMLYLFPVTSFYLYTLTSRTFRKELVKFFRVTILRRRQVIPATQGTTMVETAETHRYITSICKRTRPSNRTITVTY